jgi:hypothetical protein
MYSNYYTPFCSRSSCSEFEGYPFSREIILSDKRKIIRSIRNHGARFMIREKSHWTSEKQKDWEGIGQKKGVTSVTCQISWVYRLQYPQYLPGPPLLETPRQQDGLRWLSPPGSTYPPPVTDSNTEEPHSICHFFSHHDQHSHTVRTLIRLLLVVKPGPLR